MYNDPVREMGLVNEMMGPPPALKLFPGNNIKSNFHIRTSNKYFDVVVTTFGKVMDTCNFSIGKVCCDSLCGFPFSTRQRKIENVHFIYAV